MREQNATVIRDKREAHSPVRSWAIADPSFYVPVMGILVLAVLPIFVTNPYYMNVLNLILLFACGGMAWNIIGGYARQVSLGHSIFFGLGAYTSTLLQIHWKISPWIGMILGGLVAVGVGYVVGHSVFRLRGHYFAVATIVLSQIIRLLFIKFYTLTGGAEGLSVPMNNSFAMLQFSSKVPYYYIFLVTMLGTILLVRRIEKSRLGYYMVAMGQDEEAARVIGINIPQVKQIALAISAFLTAVMGTFFAQYMYYIEPNDIFSIPTSVEFALISIVGGLGTFLGPVLGSFIMKPIIELTNEYLADTLPGLNYAIYGLILVVIIILRPNGVIGFIGQAYQITLAKLPGYRRSLGGGLECEHSAS